MDIVQKSINYLKSLSAETVSNAGSGHTGTAVGASTIVFSLFKDHLFFDPKDPNFIARDRFVLSAGHASALLYSVLHMFGYDISMTELKRFRKLGSKTTGHPEYKLTPGVEVTTGPLGQGVAHAVGLALAESMNAEKFNTKKHKVFNNYTYCFSGDGCLMEGVALEACSLAGTLNLNKLILLYDFNNTTIDGDLSNTNAENTKLKFEAMGWNTIVVKDGHSYELCTKAIKKAKTSDKPTIIIFNTTIGLGTKHQGTPKVHGYPLPAEELAEFKASLGVSESFFVPDDVYAFCNESVALNLQKKKSWQLMFNDYKENAADNYRVLKLHFAPKKINYQKILNLLNLSDALSGRDASHVVLNELAKLVPEFVGGNADLCASTKAVIKDGGFTSAKSKNVKNISFGVREHAMSAVMNGVNLYAGAPVFDSTFLPFSTYSFPAIRLRSMMKLKVLSIFSHDSIDIGEDGATHQAIEQIGQMRLFKGLTVYRPANNAEVVAGYKYFLEHNGPMALILSRPKLQKMTHATIEDAERGAYVIFETKKKPVIEIIATGKDVELAISVANELESVGARVISMPCESLFDSQDKTYKSKVRLAKAALRVAIEASNDNIWYKYVGPNGLIVSVNDYQGSGKGNEVYANAGFNVPNILKQIQKKLK